MNAHHLGAEAAAPFTAGELAALNERRSDDAECIMPVPANAGPMPSYKKFGREADHRYEYRGLDGAVLGYVLRWDARDDQRKEFMPVTCWRNGDDKASWKPKAWPGRRPLFGLDQLAAHPDAIVLLVEGEKKVGAIEWGPLAEAFMWCKQSVIGVTWPGGAKALEQADFSPLADREVIIVPDNDEPGETAADQLVEKLHQVDVRKLRRWKAPAECGVKWDIAEEPPSNIAPETMVASILEAPEVNAQVHANDHAAPHLIDFASYAFPDPAGIPAREWLFGRHYIRSAVGASIGAPGRLKSTTVLTEIVGMSAGRNLLSGEALPSGPLRAAYLNGEEVQDELDRRVAAVCQHFDLKPEDCGGRLWVLSTRDKPIKVAVRSPRGDAMVQQDVVTALKDWCDRNQIDALAIDPLISFHAVRESDNSDMDLVCKEAFGAIAGKTRAVDLVHHPRKLAPGESNTTVDDARGASALLGAVRVARTFNFMTTAEAAQLGIHEDDRRRHVRIENGKNNPGPIGKAHWVKIDTEILPNGDEVACSTLWKPPNPFDGVSVHDLKVVQRVVQGGAFRTDSQSPQWLGWWIAENLPALGIKTRHTDQPRNKAEVARLNSILKTWLKNKALLIEKRDDEKRKPRDFFIVGKPIEAPHASAPTENIDDEIILQ